MQEQCCVFISMLDHQPQNDDQHKIYIATNENKTAYNSYRYIQLIRYARQMPNVVCHLSCRRVQILLLYPHLECQKQYLPLPSPKKAATCMHTQYARNCAVSAFRWNIGIFTGRIFDLGQQHGHGHMIRRYIGMP